MLNLSAFVATARAQLVLTIDTFTTDELSFSISGTLAADTIGDSPGYLAVKNDWSNNGGIHTEIFSATPTISLNTIMIAGVAPVTTLQNESSPWMDNIFFTNPLGTEAPITAGTTVSGSVTLLGAGVFNPADLATLELVSGFVRPFGPGVGEDWARLESSDIPEPSTAVLLLGGLGAVAALCRKPFAFAQR